MEVQSLKQMDRVTLYTSTLDAQSAIYFSKTKSRIISLSNFNSADSVLDAGCGPGAFAFQIKDILGDKKYLGVDLDSDFIRIAKKRFVGLNNFEFQEGNIKNLREGPFDIIFMYAILQHLPDVSEVLYHLRSKLKKNGRIVIVDTRGDGGNITEFPKVSELSEMYGRLDNLSRQKGRNRDCISEAIAWASGAELAIEANNIFEVKIESYEEKQIYLNYAMYLSELFERFYQLKTDQEKLLVQLSDWLHSSASYVKMMGGVWLVLTES